MGVLVSFLERLYLFQYVEFSDLTINPGSSPLQSGSREVWSSFLFRKHSGTVHHALVKGNTTSTSTSPILFTANTLTTSLSKTTTTVSLRRRNRIIIAKTFMLGLSNRRQPLNMRSMTANRPSNRTSCSTRRTNLPQSHLPRHQLTLQL